jgi:hypothetical protein
MMVPSPEHLSACTIPEPDKAKEHQYIGRVVCPCGCDAFVMQHTGATHEYKGEIIPCTAQVGREFFFRVVATCTECEVQHLLFDKDLHGWNGFVCRRELADHHEPCPPLIGWKCQVCGGETHNAHAVVSCEDMQQAIE